MTIPSVTAGGWWLISLVMMFTQQGGHGHVRSQDTGTPGNWGLIHSTYLLISTTQCISTIYTPDSHTTPIQSVFVTPNFCKSLWVQAAGRGASSVFMLSLRLHFPIGCARLLRECSRVNAVKAVCLGPGSHCMAHK